MPTILFTMQDVTPIPYWTSSTKDQAELWGMKLPGLRTASMACSNGSICLRFLGLTILFIHLANLPGNECPGYLIRSLWVNGHWYSKVSESRLPLSKSDSHYCRNIAALIVSVKLKGNMYVSILENAGKIRRVGLKLNRCLCEVYGIWPSPGLCFLFSLRGFGEAHYKGYAEETWTIWCDFNILNYGKIYKFGIYRIFWGFGQSRTTARKWYPCRM